MSAASSPCTGICQLDPATNICRGCNRTMAEIVAWPELSEEQRRHIIASLAERQQTKKAVLF